LVELLLFSTLTSVTQWSFQSGSLLMSICLHHYAITVRLISPENMYPFLHHFHSKFDFTTSHADNQPCNIFQNFLQTLWSDFKITDTNPN